MLTNPYRGQRPAWLPKKEADADNSITTYTLTPEARAELDQKLLKKYGGENVPRKPVEISREGLKALIDQGLTEKDIAAKLNRSVSTVKRIKAVKGLIGYRPESVKPELPAEVDDEETREQVTTCQYCRNLGAKVVLDEDGNCPVCCRNVEAAIRGETALRFSEACDPEKWPDHMLEYKYPSTELSKAITTVDQAHRTIHSYSAVDRAVVIAEILRGIADGLDKLEGRRVEVDVTVLEVRPE